MTVVSPDGWYIAWWLLWTLGAFALGGAVMALVNWLSVTRPVLRELREMRRSRGAALALAFSLWACGTPLAEAAITTTYRASVYSTTNTSATLTASPNYTPAANSLVVAFVVNTYSSSPSDPSGVSCHGVAMSKLTLSANALSTTHILSAWVGKMGGSPTSSACVATRTTTNGTGGALIEFEIAGADVSGTALAAIVQNPTNNGSATSGSVTLSAAGAAGNRPLSFFVHLANEATTFRTNWTETAGADGNFNNPATGAEAQFRNDAFETTASATWSTSSAWRGVAIEVKAAIITGQGPLTAGRRNHLVRF